MSASLQVEVAPAVEPVLLDVVKRHLRVPGNDEDDLIKIYLQAARELVETYVSRSLVTKGYRQNLDSFPYYIDTAQTTQAFPPSYASLPRYSTTQWNYSQLIKLMVSPLVAVSKIDYLTPDNEWLELTPALFAWKPDTEYVLGDEIEDPNGNQQTVTSVANSGEDATSSSGSSVPTWSTLTTPGHNTTVDGDLTWTCKGAAPEGDFVVDGDSEPPRLFPTPGNTWPAASFTPHAVRIHFTAGYGNSASSPFPAVAKVAILQAVANWYENRESVTDATMKTIPSHFDDLLWSIRVLDFAPTPG